MVSTRPPTSSLFNNPLITVPKAPITIGIIVTFMFHSFSIPQQTRGTYPSFHILSVLFCGQPEQQSRQFYKFSFFVVVVDYNKVWSSGLDQVIRLNVKVTQEFICVVLQDRCCVVHIPFVGMVKFQFLAHFPPTRVQSYTPVLICCIRLCDCIIIHPLELFTSALAAGFLLESERQQVSSSLQDSSQYSGRSQ